MELNSLPRLPLLCSYGSWTSLSQITLPLPVRLINIPILLSLLFLTHLILPLVSNSSPSGRSNSRPGLLAWALTNQFMWEGIGMGVVVLANGKWQGQISERAFGGGRSSGTGGKGLGGGSAGSSLCVFSHSSAAPLR